MKENGKTQLRPAALTVAPPEPVGLLRRTCACGAHGVSGECADCRKRRESGLLQRKPTGDPGHSQSLGVPPIVHEVLRSPGKPLDTATRSFMEPRFGHDFSNIRVHSDSQAGESARAVDALAYAVGPHLVFDPAHYAPETWAGRHLMAHELAHTVQSVSAALQPRLRMGPTDDPAERIAEHAADSVMLGQPVSLAPTGGTALRRVPRTCVTSSGDRPDQRNVRCSDGAEYRVTLRTTRDPDRPRTTTTANAGWNNQNIWLNISVCRGGTMVEIRPDVDLPRALVEVLGNVLTGSGALTGVTLSPGLRITIIQNQSFTLSLQPSVTVGQGGVTGGGLGATVQTRDITATAGATYDRPTGTTMFTLTLSGGRTQPTVDCRSLGRSRLVLDCERITRVPGVPAVPAVTAQDTEVRYVFFNHAHAVVRPDFRLPTDIPSLYRDGYRVISFEGFTSPEGPRERETRTFEGNIELARERARAAKDWLAQECPTCDTTGATVDGRAELPPGVGSTEPETRGRPMERSAVEEFLGASGTPDPLAPQSPADLAAFQRLSRTQQRERAFELMRRAAITLRRTRVVTERQPEVPGRTEYSATACEEDVMDSVRNSLGISIATGPAPR